MPNELLFQAFEYLCSKDIGNLATVCRRLSMPANSYLKINSVWRLKDTRGVETEEFEKTRKALVSGLVGVALLRCLLTWDRAVGIAQPPEC